MPGVCACAYLTGVNQALPLLMLLFRVVFTNAHINIPETTANDIFSTNSGQQLNKEYATTRENNSAVLSTVRRATPGTSSTRINTCDLRNSVSCFLTTIGKLKCVLELRADVTSCECLFTAVEFGRPDMV